MLSEDDLDLAGMSDEELAAAWDLWFDLAQSTNDYDPPWTHGVFVGIRELPPLPEPGADAEAADSSANVAAEPER